MLFFWLIDLKWIRWSYEPSFSKKYHLFSLTSCFCRFDILVNGGGSVTLEFTRSPFRASSVSVMVPWNQIITIDPVIMVQQGDVIYHPDPAQCGVFHDHFTLKPVVLPTWQHTQLGACPEKSTVIPESQVCFKCLIVRGKKSRHRCSWIFWVPLQ